MHIVRPLTPRESARMGIQWAYACGIKDNSHAGREPITVRGPLTGGEVSRLSIRRKYNLGNHVRQVSNAVRLAERLGIPEVQLPSDSLFVGGDVGKVRLCSIGECQPLSGSELIGDFFYFQRFGFDLQTIERGRILRSLRKLVRNSTLGPDLAPEDLVIHLRSGDVYSSRPHPLYGPPPLAFFRSVIDQLRPQRVVIVSQSEDHPYISPLSVYCRDMGIGILIQCGDLLTDFSVLRGAYNLCLSQGTLAIAASWLSEQCSQVFAFNRENSEIDDLVSLGISVAHANSALVRPWTGTKTQADELLQMDGSSLEWSYHESGL